MNAKLDDISKHTDSIHEEIIKANSSADETNITKIRLDILSLLEDLVDLYAKQNSFSLWVKDNLASAISELHWNIGRGKPDTFMLTACILSIKKSSTPNEKISKTYPHNKKHTSEIEKLNPDDFIKTIRSLRKYCKTYV